MEYLQYKQLVDQITIGKKLPDSIYTHESAINSVPETLARLILRIADALKIPDDGWNIIKFYRRDFRITFLSYPSFEEESYPTLRHSYTVDLAKLTVRKSEYWKSDNPPILHRKETFVSNSYPLFQLFKSITKEGEDAGLYKHSRSIGFKKNWERLISHKGYLLNEEGRLIPKASIQVSNEIRLEESINEIMRHRTAIDRNQLSQPMQILAKHNYLNGQWSILDYGCGKGDDLRELEAHGLDACGWDPAHNPEGLLTNSDIVNLGFVLNVIEDKDERVECLKRAWSYTEKLLISSVMIAGESVISQFSPYKDGVITSRKTFQKYFSQSEFRSFIESNLDESAIAVGQGIFIIFKDKMEEQIFLLERQHVRRDWQQKTQRELRTHVPSVKKDLIDANLDLFSDFWAVSLDLGRIPSNSEFEYSEQVRKIAGSHTKAHSALKDHFGDSLFLEAAERRKNDLLVYFALGLFGRRKPQTKMPDSLKRDIKVFYTSYDNALEEAEKTLFSVGKPEVINRACIQAHAQLPKSELNEEHDLILHKDAINDLPIELRIYIGCATQLYGNISDFQLIKVHITSGKVSLLRYSDWDTDTPMLVERIKIKMREQEIDIFDYSGNFEPAPLLNKNKFI
tara:strand:+ start:39277 stop:41154 length:1878 start_codon:yes stop_codon:yes gene_type:complete